MTTPANSCNFCAQATYNKLLPSKINFGGAVPVIWFSISRISSKARWTTKERSAACGLVAFSKTVLCASASPNDLVNGHRVVGDEVDYGRLLLVGAMHFSTRQRSSRGTNSNKRWLLPELRMGT